MVLSPDEIALGMLQFLAAFVPVLLIVLRMYLGQFLNELEAAGTPNANNSVRRMVDASLLGVAVIAVGAFLFALELVSDGISWVVPLGLAANVGSLVVVFWMLWNLRNKFTLAQF